MTKQALILIAVFTTIMASYGYNYTYSMSNPSNPVSPLNPANPLNPTHSLNLINRRQAHDPAPTEFNTYNHKNKFTYRKYRMYEYCYNDKCRQTENSDVSHKIRRCLNYDGGNACLNIIIK